MKKSILLAAAAALIIAGSALAATTTYKVQSGDTWESIAAKYGISVQALADLNQPSRGDRLNVPVVTPPPPPPPPVDVCPNIAGVQTTVPAGDQLVNGNCVPIVVTPPPTGEIKLTNVYTTAYGWPDNTPPGSQTTIMGVSGHDGGTGTYADPITMATGFSLAGGKETDDYAAGTKFYDPNLRKYFVVGDTCGDGPSPQTEPCHKSEIAGTIQLDLWVGGQGLSSSGTLACEDAITRTGTLVENPGPEYIVVAGPVYNGACATQYGDTLVLQ